MSRQTIRLASSIGESPTTFTNYFANPIILPPRSTIAFKEMKLNPESLVLATSPTLDEDDIIFVEITGLPSVKSCRTQFSGKEQNGQVQTNALIIASFSMSVDQNGDLVSTQTLSEFVPNFIPLGNTSPLSLTALGITMRMGDGGILSTPDALEDIELIEQCTFAELLFDVELPVFDMRSLANLLRPTQDMVVAQQTEVVEKVMN
jgi:hypothetical protein